MDAAAARLRGSTTVHNPVSSKHAAVLVPLFEPQRARLKGTVEQKRLQDRTGTVRVVLTRRSSKLSSHQGEVAFPGGKREPADKDDVATALREAMEEVALPPEAAEVLAIMPPVLSKHYLSVTPVVARIPAGIPLTPSEGEVESIFDMPLQDFLIDQPSHSHQDVTWSGNVQYRLHFFQHAHQSEVYNVWGLTAGILVHVAQVALGKSAEFEAISPGSRPFTDIWYDGSKVVYRDES